MSHVAVAGAATLAAVAVAIPRLLRLGATEDEARQPMPGDDEVPAAQVQGTRAITIDAPPERVWPWIAQIGYHGYGRAGWYAFDLADNDGVRSAWEVIADFQSPHIGQLVGEEGSTIQAIEPNRLLLLSYHWPTTVWVRKQGLWPKFGHCSWAFLLDPMAGGRTRLVVRTRYRVDRVDLSLPYWPLFLVSDLLMQPTMLRGIKRRVERPAESGRAGASVDRLTGQDLSNLSAEAAGWPQDIGVIAVLDGSGLTDADGRLRIELARLAIARRLDLVPRLRQVISRPGFGLGGPLWADAEAFDLANHVRVRTLAGPADDAALLDACESLRRTPLDWSRPLWELWLLPGLSGGRVGMFFRLHHVVADGMAGAALIGALLDAAPGALPMQSAAGWVPRPMPTKAELIADNVRRRARTLRAPARVLAHPIRAARRAGHPKLAVAGVLRVAPRTSLNRPIGADRRIAVIRGELGSVADAAHARRATVNDMILAAVAGGLRELLRRRGEATDGLVLRAAVPVSLHRGAREHASGNIDGGMNVPLPVGEADPFTRLRLIADATAVLKSKATSQVFTGILASSAIQKLGLLFMTRQRLVNVYVANVPGPSAALYLGPARLTEVFAFVPLLGNVTLGVGVLSYAGQLNITVVADRDSCADLPVFAEALRSALAELTAGATGTDSLPDVDRSATARPRAWPGA